MENMTMTTFRNIMESEGAKVLVAKTLRGLCIYCDKPSGDVVSEDRFGLWEGTLDCMTTFFNGEQSFEMPRVGASVDGASVVIEVADTLRKDIIDLESLEEWLNYGLKEELIIEEDEELELELLEITREEEWKNDHLIKTVPESIVGNLLDHIDNGDIDEDIAIEVLQAFENSEIDETQECWEDKWFIHNDGLLGAMERLSCNRDFSAEEVGALCEELFRRRSAVRTLELIEEDRVFMGDFESIGNNFNLEIPEWLVNKLNADDVLQWWGESEGYDVFEIYNRPYGQWLVISE